MSDRNKNIAIGVLVVLVLCSTISLIVNYFRSPDCPALSPQQQQQRCIPGTMAGKLGTDVQKIYAQFANVDNTVLGIENSQSFDLNTKCANLNNIINIVNNRKDIVANVLNEIAQDRINNVNAAKARIQCPS
jgi:hypothetical protein